jgi:hypothetical protein
LETAAIGWIGFGAAERGFTGFGSGFNLLNPGTASLSFNQSPSRIWTYSANLIMVSYLRPPTVKRRRIPQMASTAGVIIWA